MSPDSLQTLVLYVAIFLYGIGFAMFLFSIIYNCWRFFFSNNPNQLDDDIELGRQTSINPPPSPRFHALPAWFETRLPNIPGAKPLTGYNAADECAVCLQDFKQKDDCLVFARCNHVFHKPCAEEWMKISPSCPICRTNAYYIYIDV